jgi:hypothetical protein
MWPRSRRDQAYTLDIDLGCRLRNRPPRPEHLTWSGMPFVNCSEQAASEPRCSSNHITGFKVWCGYSHAAWQCSVFTKSHWQVSPQHCMQLARRGSCKHKKNWTTTCTNSNQTVNKHFFVFFKEIHYIGCRALPTVDLCVCVRIMSNDHVPMSASSDSSGFAREVMKRWP